MSEGIQAAILFTIVFAACYACFKVGIAEGKAEERRLQQRIRATQYDLRKNRNTPR
jgi:hypothetical protein